MTVASVCPGLPLCWNLCGEFLGIISTCGYNHLLYQWEHWSFKLIRCCHAQSPICPMKSLSLREVELMPLLLQMRNLREEVYCPIQDLPVRQWQILTPGPAFLKHQFRSLPRAREWHVNFIGSMDKGWWLPNHRRHGIWDSTTLPPESWPQINPQAWRLKGEVTRWRRNRS